MARALPVLILLATLVVVFGGLALAWRARGRRQAHLPDLAEVPAGENGTRLVDDLLYVATTRADAPLERIRAGGLAFRGRASLSVRADGIRLDLAGRPPGFIPRFDLRGVGRATWTLDRVVDRDGLVFVRWRLGDLEVDSYVRSTDPDALVAAILPIVPAVAAPAPSKESS